MEIFCLEAEDAHVDTKDEELQVEPLAQMCKSHLHGRGPQQPVPGMDLGQGDGSHFQTKIH